MRDHPDNLSPANTSPDGREIDWDARLRDLGYDGFRPGQREAVETLLQDGSLLLVAPTGGGKSLTYQLPATALPGTTLVVSPLVSLMHDQVTALLERGVEATFLAATLGAEEMRTRMAGMARGEYKIVYVSPERLVFDGFRSLLHDIDCPLIAIDEAHCISEWGHDFRPEYMQIGRMLQSVRPRYTLACTATATPIVRDAILDGLGLGPETPQIVQGFARPNLALSVEETATKRDRERAIDRALAEALGKPNSDRGTAIIYTPTRRAAEQTAERLTLAGWRCDPYHAGLTGKIRDRTQERFQQGRLEVVAATNAFGMGIDRSDVRLVIHLAPPGSVEAYYQEVGRAGRDGEPAAGMLLTSPGDMALRRRLIESDVENRSPNPEMVAHRWEMFLELMRWAEGGSCRHDAILRYFGDEAETLQGCGHCDVCRRLGSESVAENPEETTLIVRKALSAAARVHGRFGLQLAAKLLAGKEDNRLEWSGLRETKTFGVLSDRREAWLLALLRRCVSAGWIDFQGGDKPAVVLTESGRQVMVGERPARLLLPPESAGKAKPGTTAERRSGRSGVGKSGSGGGIEEGMLDAQGEAVFEALRKHRLELAHEQDVPPYVVASDRTLRDIAALRPQTLAQLELAHGIGPSKLEKYGMGFLEAVREASD